MKGTEPKMTLVDTCYGFTGGDKYVCPRCKSTVVTRRNEAAPTCPCIMPQPESFIAPSEDKPAPKCQREGCANDVALDGADYCGSRSCACERQHKPIPSSQEGRTERWACGAVNPITGMVCVTSPHAPEVGHIAGGETWYSPARATVDVPDQRMEEKAAEFQVAWKLGYEAGVTDTRTSSPAPELGNCAHEGCSLVRGEHRPVLDLAGNEIPDHAFKAISGKPPRCPRCRTPHIETGEAMQSCLDCGHSWSATADDGLVYAATVRCPCGAGVAYPKDIGPRGFWECSAIIKGTANPDVQHEARLPFTFYEIKSENQPSANGETTRTLNEKGGR